MSKGYAGCNELHLNTATMMLAVQAYLDSLHLPGKAPRVVGFKEGRDACYVVRTEELKQEPAK